MMSGFDIVLILIIAGFAFYGLFHGLIKTIGAIVALIVGVWLANFLYLPVYGLVKKFFFSFETLGQIVVFMILFAIFNRLISFLFLLFEASYNSLFFIPFLKSINRLLGAIFGLVLGGLVVGLALYGLLEVGIFNSLLSNHLKGSKVAPLLLKYAAIIVPLLPNLWERIKGWWNPQRPNLKGTKLDSINLESFNIDKLKEQGGVLKDKLWNTAK